MIEKLDRLLGPWAVSGPAIEIGIQAFGDLVWQARSRNTYRETVKRLDLLLSSAGLQIVGGTDLFRLVSHPCAWAVHERLALRGVWVRRFDDAPNWLRFGLPGNDAEFSKLAAALGVSEPLSSMRAPNCVA